VALSLVSAQPLAGAVQAGRAPAPVEPLQAMKVPMTPL
jgi:hypothetical protein